MNGSPQMAGHPYHSEDMNPNHFDQDDADDDGFSGRPSKSALKRESHELQALGKQLLEMPERLRDALEAYKRTRSFEGKRRQIQFIGKVMRGVDAEPLREAVAQFQLGHARNALALHQAERWRAELLSDDKDALTNWAATFPDSDLQQLRNLVRSARKDAAEVPEKRSGRAYRELFQFIKHAMEAQDEPDEDIPGGAPT